MPAHLRIEDPSQIYFITTRTTNSRLWFINNKQFQQRVLTFLARYQELHEVILYGFVLMGNHYHLVAKFPKANRAAFMKDFNARFSMSLRMTSEHFDGGRLWARPYKPLALPNEGDVENWLFYCFLNPIYSGLVDRLSEYDSYSSFADASTGRVRKFKFIDWTTYRDKKRFNPKLSPDDFATIHHLRYSRLPGYEHLSDREYRTSMDKKLEEYRQTAVKKRITDEKGFAGKKVLRNIRVGAKPVFTKTSASQTNSPLVLTLCADTRRRYREWYFTILDAYKKASTRYREGAFDATFPPGTYRPLLRAIT